MKEFIMKSSEEMFQIEHILNSGNYGELIKQQYENSELRELANLLHLIAEDSYLRSPKDMPFTEYNYQPVKDLLSRIQDLKEIATWNISCFLVAKIHDFIWINTKQHSSAITSLHKYLDTISMEVSKENFCHSIYRIIALRKQRIHNNEDNSDLIMPLKKYALIPPFSSSLSLLRTCLDYSILSYTDLLDIIESMLVQLKADPDTNYKLVQEFAKLYEAIWAQKHNRKINQIPQETPQIIRVRETVVECLIKAAHLEYTDAVRRIQQSMLIKDAIHTLEQIPNSNDQRKQLRLELEKVQKSLLGQMVSHEYSLNLEKEISQIRNTVAVLTKEESLYYLACCFKAIDFSTARKIVINNYQEYPIANLFPTNIVDKNGRTRAKLPSLSNTENETILRQHMIHQTATTIFGGGFIAMHILNAIEMHHQIEEIDIQNIVNDSVFVPASRKKSFTKGLWLGFQKDYMAALYILIPQFENAFRHLVTACGEPVYSLKADGTEEVRTLHSLVEQASIQEIFDNDLIFAIQTLFCSPYGLNLRNEQAHGITDDSFYDSESAVIVWWYIFCLCYRFRKASSLFPIKKSILPKLNNINSKTNK